MSTPPKTLAEARAKIAELEKNIADLKRDRPEGADVPGTVIPLEAAALILSAWAKGRRVAIDGGTMYGEKNTYHVRNTDEGQIRLSIEPPAFAEAERLETKRVAEIALAEAIADVRGAVAALAAAKASGNADGAADHIQEAETAVTKAKAKRKAAEETLNAVATERAPSFEVEIPGDLAGLTVLYRE